MLFIVQDYKLVFQACATLIPHLGRVLGVSSGNPSSLSSDCLDARNVSPHQIDVSQADERIEDSGSTCSCTYCPPRCASHGPSHQTNLGAKRC